MSQFWSPELSRLEPYVPGEQPQDQQYIKLNTNENPYPPSPAALAAIASQADENIRLYPDPESVKLKQTIADYYSVSSEQVFTGNGSDEVLALAFYSFFRRPEPLLFPEPSYSFYPVYCSFFGLESNRLPVDEDFCIQLEEYEGPSSGVIFPNPNAPTGRYLELDEIRQFLQSYRDRVVIVDEAYIDFGGESAVSLVNEFENLLVVQTFSKSRSLAGMRVGFAIGSAVLIDGLQRAKNSFNSYPLDRLAQAAAVAALKDSDYFNQRRKQIIDTREQSIKLLTKLGFNVIPSKANFVLASPPDGNAEALYLNLKQRGILVRYFKQARIDRYVRITIGTNDEMNALQKALTGLYG